METIDQIIQADHSDSHPDNQKKPGYSNDYLAGAQKRRNQVVTKHINSSRLNLSQRGFTLIEIMVVVVILGILASVVVPRIMDNPDKARTAKAKHDIQALESALDVYRLDNFAYPSTDQGLEALISKPDDAANWKAGGYVKKLNKDPWGNDYLYLNPGEHGEIDIFSYGADGAPGGDGPAADIGSWDTQ